MKFLIIRLDAIGDIVLTTPLVRCLKKQVPLAEVHYLVKPGYEQVLEHNPYINTVHLYDDAAGMIEKLKAQNFDLLIDLYDSRESRYVSKNLSINVMVYRHSAFAKTIFKNFKVNLMPDLHMVERFMKTVYSLGVRYDGQGLDYFIPPSENISEKDLPASHQLGYIAMAIGGSAFNKKMPVEKISEFCRRIDHPVILLGGKGDSDTGNKVSAIDPVKIYNACGKFSLHETADLIKRSKMLVSHDTGLVHIAAALRKPVISIWGATVPSFGRTPFYPDPDVKKTPPNSKVQVKKLWCRPCTEHGLDHCPMGHFKCMKNIRIDELVDNVKTVLSKIQNSNSLTEG